MSTDQGVSWRLLGPGPSASQIWDSRPFYAINNHLFVQTFDTVNRGTIWYLDLNSLSGNISIFERFGDGSKLIQVQPGDSISISFVPGAGTLTAVDSVLLSLRYDRNVVYPLEFDLAPGWWIADSSSSSEFLRLVLRDTIATVLPTPFLHARFKTYLSPTSGMKSIVRLDSAINYITPSTQCGPAELSLAQADSVEIDFTGCGDSLLLDAMRGEPLFDVESIIPNPGRDEIRVLVRGDNTPAIRGELFDLLGNRSLDVAEVRGTSLRVGQLPSGTYYLRLSSGGYIVTRRVVIEH